MSNQLIDKIVDECHRIEEDALYSSKSHYNVSSRWEKFNLILGVPLSVLAAVTGIAALKNLPNATIIISFILTILTALNTALNPSKKGSLHKSAAGDYNILKNEVRVFREIDLHDTVLTEKDLRSKLKVYSDRRNQLNHSSPNIPQWAYKKTQQDIKNNFAIYQIDKE
ncbi:SLATT domain-containing protein [Rouxiella sp. T17]|uniref:SLATT domain-containing protein n=1 Tax=Rouxiella sp. T17 TaxID=3085684 RepID=UPI002FCA0FD4